MLLFVGGEGAAKQDPNFALHISHKCFTSPMSLCFGSTGETFEKPTIVEDVSAIFGSDPAAAPISFTAQVMLKGLFLEYSIW